MTKDQFEFSLVAYQLAIKTYNEISNRVSTRFNIILTIDIVLAGYFINTWFNDKINLENGSLIMPIMGVLISIFLYFQSAQDKYILKKQIERVNMIKDRILSEINMLGFPCLFSPLDSTDSIGKEKPKKNFEFINLFCWRSNLFSVTKIPGWISCFLLIIWIIIIILNWHAFFR